MPHRKCPAVHVVTPSELCAMQEQIINKDFSCLVIQGDCRDVIEMLPDNSVDLTVMDPAYESLERHRAKGTTTRLTNSAKSSNAWFQTFPNDDYHGLLACLHKAHRLNTHCYIFCDSETEHVILSGYNPYTAMYYRDQGFKLPPTGPWKAWPPIVWAKTKIGKTPHNGEELQQEDIRSGMGYHWRRAEERILFLEKGKRKLNNLGWPNVLCGPRAGKNDYPTEKPMMVLTKLVENSSNPGDVVVDLFAGSGSTGRAALACGRRAILVDLNIDWILAHLSQSMEGNK